MNYIYIYAKLDPLQSSIKRCGMLFLFLFEDFVNVQYPINTFVLDVMPHLHEVL
jgi:hypothetical protein